MTLRLSVPPESIATTLGRPWATFWSIVMQQDCLIHHIQVKTVPFHAQNTPFQGFLPQFYISGGCLIFVCKIWHIWSKVMAMQHVTHSGFCVRYTGVFFIWHTSCFGKMQFLTLAKNSVILRFITFVGHSDLGSSYNPEIPNSLNRITQFLIVL